MIKTELVLICVNFASRSIVPPVRDEESETQRKAHAKRVRETRRSTQGVTLEEIKSAEQLVKKKNVAAAAAAASTTTTTPGNSSAEQVLNYLIFILGFFPVLSLDE